MIYELSVWIEDEIDRPPVMETQLEIDEELDKELINVISANLKIAFEVLYNKIVMVEFYERQNPLCLA